MARTLFSGPSKIWRNRETFYTALVEGVRHELPATGDNFALLTKMVADARKARAAAKRKAKVTA